MIATSNASAQSPSDRSSRSLQSRRARTARTPAPSAKNAVTTQACAAFTSSWTYALMTTRTIVSATATSLIHAIQISWERRRSRVTRALREPFGRPLGVLAQERVVALRVAVDERREGLVPGVAGRDERVAAQVARVVARDEQPLVALAQLLVGRGQPVGERDDRLGARGERLARAPLLGPAVPGADVLADVAAVDLDAERLAVLLRHGVGRLRPVREAARRVELARLVERAGRAGVDAEAARAAVERERRRRLDLRLGEERPEHDPRAVPARDQHRVLAVEPDPRPDGALAVDVLVRVDEHAVGAAERAAERVELLAQLRVAVVPGVARQPPLPRPGLRDPGRSTRARRRRRCARRAGAAPGDRRRRAAPS